MSSVGVHVRCTDCCSHPGRTGFLVPPRVRTTTGTKEGEWHEIYMGYATENREASTAEYFAADQPHSSMPAAEAA